MWLIFPYISRIAKPDPNPNWIRIQSGQWIQIRIRIRNLDPGPGGQKIIHKSRKEGGLYYMGGTYIFFLHPKWSKLCTVPLMGPKNPPTRIKLKKNIFDLLFGPFKKVIFCSFYAFPGGT